MGVGLFRDVWGGDFRGHGGSRKHAVSLQDLGKVPARRMQVGRGYGNSRRLPPRKPAGTARAAIPTSLTDVPAPGPWSQPAHSLLGWSAEASA